MARHRLGVAPLRRLFQKAMHPLVNADTSGSFQQGCHALLWELGQERTEPRRNRINPRVVKRKMSQWLEKRPEHRHPAPLSRTYDESVVMVHSPADAAGIAVPHHGYIPSRAFSASWTIAGSLAVASTFRRIGSKWALFGWRRKRWCANSTITRQAV